MANVPPWGLPPPQLPWIGLDYEFSHLSFHFFLFISHFSLYRGSLYRTENKGHNKEQGTGVLGHGRGQDRPEDRTADRKGDKTADSTEQHRGQDIGIGQGTGKRTEAEDRTRDKA